MFITEKLIAALAPHNCLVCGKEGAVVCAWCLPDFAPPLPTRCYKCHSADPTSKVCSTCRRHSPLKHVWIRTLYDQDTKQLISSFKFERMQAAALPMASLMAEALPFLDVDTIITHIPTATSRTRKRGYDHAELLAKALAGQLGLRHQTLLRRVTQTRQVRSTRKQRIEQMEDAFRPVANQQLSKAKILMVDDLTTTGATLESAARCLNKTGVKSIDAVVFAQKQ